MADSLVLNSNPRLDPSSADRFEVVPCLGCGSLTFEPLLTAEDDLTGKPGRFQFVRCSECGLAYQNPRLRLEHIHEFYGEDYIAHRRPGTWGPLAPLFQWAVEGVERRKERLVGRYMEVGSEHAVLDVGCGAGGFLRRMRRSRGAKTTGVDFKDLSKAPGLEGSQFRCGLFYDQDFGDTRFDLVTFWHFLEHDYEPARSLDKARSVLSSSGLLIVEVPRFDSVTRKLFQDRWPGLQAPQHTVLFTRDSLLRMALHCGFEVVDYLPYGAFPAYFYLFTGVAFKWLRGRGLNLRKALLPYLVGQAVMWPLLVFETRLNLAMQTIVCRRKP